MKPPSGLGLRSRGGTKGRHHSVSSARHVYRKRFVCSPPLGAHSTCAVDLCEARDFAGVGLVFIMVPSCRPASRREPLLPQVIDTEPLMTLHWRYMPMLPRREYGFAGLGFGTGSVIFRGRYSRRRPASPTNSPNREAKEATRVELCSPKESKTAESRIWTCSQATEARKQPKQAGSVQ